MRHSQGGRRGAAQSRVTTTTRLQIDCDSRPHVPSSCIGITRANSTTGAFNGRWKPFFRYCATRAAATRLKSAKPSGSFAYHSLQRVEKKNHLDRRAQLTTKSWYSDVDTKRSAISSMLQLNIYQLSVNPCEMNAKIDVVFVNEAEGCRLGSKAQYFFGCKR